MTARTMGLLCVVWVSGCVLPDYEVGNATEQGATKENKDAGTTTAKDEKPISMLPGADEACASCLTDNCQTERDDCGADCAALKWPVSPAWKVTDQADSFVRCLAMQCEDSCKVSWGCNDNYVLPLPRDNAFPITIRVTGALSGNEIAGVSVSACQGLDPSCSDDLGLVSSGVTDATGRALLTLSSGFDGYFLLDVQQEQADGSKYVPMTVKWSEQLYRVESELTASLFEAPLISALANGVEKIMPGTGNFIFKSQNCLPERYVGKAGANASAAGVKVSYTALGKGSRVYYVTGGFAIDPDATDTSTAGAGFGGVFNVTPGPVSVTGVHDGVGVSTGGFPMRADTLGAVFMLPKAKR